MGAVLRASWRNLRGLWVRHHPASRRRWHLWPKRLWPKRRRWIRLDDQQPHDGREVQGPIESDHGDRGCDAGSDGDPGAEGNAEAMKRFIVVAAVGLLAGSCAEQAVREKIAAKNAAELEKLNAHVGEK